ncbi:MAG: DsbA family protein [Gemmatimonadetes bacterium]|nr:DsbA family protein [Gemmatimonadota bacterium]MDA1104449.1 DsbA family protein [Gemmatimonadota bacterium]
MKHTPVQFFFDFSDPVSYLVARELAAIDHPAGRAVAWVPFERRPPPASLVTTDDPALAARWASCRQQSESRDILFAPARLVPWTRKSHELALYAETHGVGDAVRNRIFEAYLLEGRDIGRVDVLVEIGVAFGLDVTETKAVLDVDRFEQAVLEAREEALQAGVTDAPTIVAGGGSVRGFHNRTALGTFLGP